MQARILSTIGIATLLLGIYWAGIGAQQDTEPPHLVEFDFEPKTLDTSTESQTITVTARIADNLSGLDNGTVDFVSPTETQDITGSFSHHNRTSGDELDGIYTIELTLPRHSERGTWLAKVTLRDTASNTRVYEHINLAAAGFPFELVNGEPTSQHTPTPTAKPKPTRRPAPIPIKADILFVLDTTESMSWVMETIQEQADEITSYLQALFSDVRLGMVDFRDYSYDPYGGSTDWPYRLRQPLTPHTSSFRSAILELQGNGGGDIPEAYTRALYEAYADENIGWRPEAHRFIIMLGDSFPHDDNLNAGIPTPQPHLPGFEWRTGLPPTYIDPGRDATGGTNDDLDFHTVLGPLHDLSTPLLFIVINGRSPELEANDLLVYWQTWTAMTGPGGNARILGNPGDLPRIILELLEEALSSTPTITPTPTLTSTPLPTRTPTSNPSHTPIPMPTPTSSPTATPTDEPAEHPPAYLPLLTNPARPQNE